MQRSLKLQRSEGEDLLRVACREQASSPSRHSSNSASAYKGTLHTYALMLNSTYPQVIHSVWKLTSTRGQDIAIGEGRSKVR